MSTFNQVKKVHIKTLEQYVPIVARVHGAHHPEFHKVRQIFDELNAKIKKAGANTPELGEEFASLRALSNNYTVPNDVCESYEAVYVMLKELDNAYHS